MRTEWMLVKRELIRFFRQRNRVFGAIGQPIVFWLLFSAGFRDSFQYQTSSGSLNYQEYYFPGTIALIVLFTSIFSSFSIIEDRNEGFLKGVLVAPVARRSIVFGKVLGAGVLATIQALFFLVLSPLAGISLGLISTGLAIGIIILMSVELAMLGFFFAWRMDSTAGFHAVMSVLLLPMWLLSGAFFPLESGPWWLMWLGRLNPMTYGVGALRQALYLSGEGSATLFTKLPGIGVSVMVSVGFLAVLTVLTLRGVKTVKIKD